MSSPKDTQMNVLNFSPTSLEGNSLIWTMTLHYRRQAFVLKRLSLYRKEINIMAWPLSAYPFFPFPVRYRVTKYAFWLIGHRAKVGQQVTCLLFYFLLSPMFSFFSLLLPPFQSSSVFFFFLLFFLSYLIWWPNGSVRIRPPSTGSRKCVFQ